MLVFVLSVVKAIQHGWAQGFEIPNTENTGLKFAHHSAPAKNFFTKTKYFANRIKGFSSGKT